MTKTLQIGHHIWFIIEHDSHGVMTGLQEHDWREGGNLRKPDGITWEEFLLERVAGRVSDDIKEYTVNQTLQLLKSKDTTLSLFMDK